MIPTDKIIQALENNKGLIQLTAKQLGCTPQCIYKRAKKNAKIQEVINNAREYIVDTAELSLYTMVLNGDRWAIGKVLENLGKNRGYGKKHELELSSNKENPLGVTLVINDTIKESNGNGNGKN